VLSEPGYALLHDLRLRGLVVVDDGSVQTTVVAEVVEAGYATPARSAIRITAEGRAAHETWARVSGADHEAAVVRGYERFLPLNLEFLRVCHDWQLRPGDVPNDHRDVRYDWSVIDRLRALDERTAPVVRRVARSVPRFDAYPRRLREALRRVDDGDIEWVTSPRIDSYHTIWMQLHEDLLLALGRRRENESDPNI
jgi:hypothetical protein